MQAAKGARERAVRRSAAVLVLALWALEFALLLGSQKIGNNWPARSEILRQAGVATTGVLISGALGYKLIRERQRPIVQLAAIAVGLAASFAVANTLASVAARSLLVADGMGFRHSHDTSGQAMALSFIFWFRVFLSGAGALLAIAYALDARESEERAASLHGLAHRAQLRALRYQINPHFLFNALNAVSSLVTGAENDRAEAVLANLSDFLRASLATDPLEDIPLWREIDYERLYLEIEQVRFPYRLRIEIDQPDAVRDALVPSLILQPLIENVIKHAVATAVAPVTMRLSANTNGAALMIEVSDNGPPTAATGFTKGTNVGLENVRDRLETRYPGAVEFDAGPQPGGGFRVRFAIPMRRAA